MIIVLGSIKKAVKVTFKIKNIAWSNGDSKYALYWEQMLT